MTRTTSLLTLAAITAAPVLAQQAPTQAELVAKYEAKLTADYIPFGGWLIDYDEARAKAAATGKMLFTYFSRSYSP